MRLLRAHLPGFRRHHQGQLLDQVVPGPRRVLGGDQDQALVSARAWASRVGGPVGARPA